VGTRLRLAAACCAAVAAFALAGCDQNQSKNKTATEKDVAVSAGSPAQPISAEQLGAPATPAQQALYEGAFEAVGSEPFWRLDLLNDWAAFTRPGLQEVGGLPEPREFRAQGARVVAGPLTIVLKAQPCAHESGGTYPYTATVYFEGVPYEGCARKGGDQTQADSDWTGTIGQLLPAIDSCLARADKKPARVTIAYALDGGQAAVRLRDAEGGRWECNAPVTGGAASYWDSIGDRDVMQGENDPQFTRNPGPPPPQTNCSHNTPAKGAGGGSIGWYTRKTC